MLYFFSSPTIAIVTIFLNSLLIYTLIKQYRCNKRGKEQKHSIPLIFLANLAVSDLLVGLTLASIKVIFYLNYYRVIRWSLGVDWTYRFMKYTFLRLSLLTSVFNLASLTLDRFLAIRYPIVHRTTVTKNKAFVVVGITWLLSTIFTAAHYSISNFNGFVFWQYDLVIFPAVVFPAAFVFAICYSLILFTIRKQGREMRDMLTGHCTTEARCDKGRNPKMAIRTCSKTHVWCSSEMEEGDYKESGILTDICSGKRKETNSISVILSSETGMSNRIANVRMSGCQISKIKGSACCQSTGGVQSSVSSQLRTKNIRSSRPLHVQRREIKIYRFVGTVVGVFLLCWLPIAICGAILMRRPVSTLVVYSVFTFAFANSVIDPILCFLFNYKMHGKVRRLIGLIFQCACAKAEGRLQNSDSLFGPSSGGSNSALIKT